MNLNKFYRIEVIDLIHEHYLIENVFKYQIIYNNFLSAWPIRFGYNVFEHVDHSLMEASLSVA